MLSNDTRSPTVRVWTPLSGPACRLCGARLHRTLVDLGCVPLANRTITAEAPDEDAYRLQASICDNCALVQLTDVAAAKPVGAAPLTTRSSASLNQERRYAETMRTRLRLDRGSLVIEVGSSDGSLLRHFKSSGAQVLGIEPDPTAAAAANQAGIPTEVAQFNTETAMAIAVRHGCADLVVAKDVLPHALDLFDFAAGFANILRPNGVLAVQVHHLLSLIQKVQFDAFRHDCYAYLSLRVLEHVLRSVGLRVFDAEFLPDNGGSLRVHACHVVAPHAARPSLKAARLAESFGERDRRGFYDGFSDRVAEAQEQLRAFLRTRRSGGRRVAAYGVTTRGNTLLNCCRITTEEIAYVADADPAKHGRLLPGSRLPIVALETLMADPPDDILILPWPCAAKVTLKMLPLRQRGTQFWTPLPRITRV